MGKGTRVGHLPALLLGAGAWLVAAAVVPALVTAAEEEFHHTYTLDASGRVSLENINGNVHVTTWDRNEVKIDALKRAPDQERLEAIEIKIDSDPAALRIKTRYYHHFNNDPGGVDYTLTVPRAARLDRIELVNGALEASDLTGEVNASSVNGRIKVRGLSGDVRLSVVNGNLEAAFDRLDESKTVSLDSVNGGIDLGLPSDASADVSASTVSGSIHNDFGLPVSGHFVGHELHGTLGDGRARVKLSDVNGSIKIHREREISN